MKRRLLTLCLVICLSLMCCSCTVEGDRIYTICRETESTTYVYNESGEFFTYSDGTVIPCATGGLQAQPRLIIRFDDISDFSLEPIMPTVYSGTKEDCLHYITKVLKELDGKYALVSVDWKSFEMLITTNEYDIRVIYTNNNTVRIYANSAEGGVLPPFLEVNS